MKVQDNLNANERMSGMLRRATRQSAKMSLLMRVEENSWETLQMSVMLMMARREAQAPETRLSGG